MYTTLGQQAPLLQRTNPDGSVTYYYGPVAEAVTEAFPEARAATPVPEAERVAAVARTQAGAERLPGWVLPVGGVVALLLLFR